MVLIYSQELQATPATSQERIMKRWILRAVTHGVYDRWDEMLLEPRKWILVNEFYLAWPFASSAVNNMSYARRQKVQGYMKGTSATVLRKLVKDGVSGCKYPINTNPNLPVLLI